MSYFERSWNRLTALARRADAAPPEEAPPGFSTRVVALAFSGRSERVGASVWEWLAVRGLGVACLVMGLALAASWPMATNAAEDELADLADPLIVADATP
jgi:hypothetical protein